jgi:ornithine carbamoyltransferase
MFAGAQLGANVWLATPPGHEPNLDALSWTRLCCAETKGSCTVTHDPQMAAFGADVIYTDVWTSMGSESQAQKRQTVFRPYQVDSALFGHAKNDCIFLHCLPAHRGDEVTDEVIDGPRSFVFQQAENRLHAQKAILVELLARRGAHVEPNVRTRAIAEIVR